MLSEGQIFRIDHFLGKEGLQNILALRFANAFVEPVFDRDHVDSIQIDVPEELTIAGRAGFYEQTGCLKDMVTTHLLQVLGFVAMEPPVSLAPEALRDRTRGVFESLQPIDPVPSSTASTRGIAPSRASRRTRPSRRSSPPASRSTRGAGRACRSSCAPGRRWRCRARR